MPDPSPPEGTPEGPTGGRADDLLELEVGAIAAGGGCVGRAPDGKVVFVRHSLPGERVRARVTARTTSYLRADAVEILTRSPDRVQAPCPHAGPGRCGGCDFQHVELGAQRRLKAYRIAEQLGRLADLDRAVEVEPVAGDADGLGWRSRVRVAVDGRGAPGVPAPPLPPPGIRPRLPRGQPGRHRHRRARPSCGRARPSWRS